MKIIFRLFLLISLAEIMVGCSFHSYQSALTEVKIPNYRKPDSLKVVDEEQSAASLFWQD